MAIHRHTTAAGDPVILVVITVTFFLVRMAPGGPFDSEKPVTREVKAALEAQYKLDLPLYQQYFSHGDLAHGDLGPSFKYSGRSVNELIAAGFPVTAELGLYACWWRWASAAWRHRRALGPTRQDYIPMSAAMIGICMPFLLGPCWCWCSASTWTGCRCPAGATFRGQDPAQPHPGLRLRRLHRPPGAAPACWRCCQPGLHPHGAGQGCPSGRWCSSTACAAA